MKEKLFLIDGTALLYRAYYAFIRNPLINSKQENTSAIYGVINSFISLVDKMDSRYIAIAFDRAAPTFRHLDYAEYKANRPPMPDDLRSQIAAVIEFFKLIKVPDVGADGFEADDALGTMGTHFGDDFEIVYVTSDKDYCQLIDENAIMYDPMKEQILDADFVREKYGVDAAQFIDYLALVGDSSDNIPGVRGIGPVAAQALLNSFAGIDEIYANIENVDKKYQKKLIENKDTAYLSKHLATIVRDAEIAIPKREELLFDPQNMRKAVELLKRYEIMSLQRRIEARIEAQYEPEPTQADIFAEEPKPAEEELREVVQEEAQEEEGKAFKAILVNENTLPKVIAELEKAAEIALDVETDGLDALEANLVGMSLCTNPRHSYYLPLGHSLADNLPLECTLSQIFKAINNKRIIGHNLKFDFAILKRYNMALPAQYFDTMIAAYILDAGAISFSLDNCAYAELGYKMMSIKELIGSGKNQSTFDIISPEDACFYAAEDAWVTLRLFQIYQKKLEISPAKEVFYKMDLPLMPVLMRMEENGVSIDRNILSTLSVELNKQIKELTEEIYKVAGYELNLNSPAQLSKLLFEDMKLPTKKKIKSGYSTDNSVLEALSEDYEIAGMLINYRQLNKLENTYVSALPRLVSQKSGRIHSSFNQCVASTGRLSSTNPNLQNIPVRTPLGREIRKAFVAKNDDFLILAADYSQIELRLLALMSRDEVLIRAFKDKTDIHKETAAQIYSVALDEVDSDMRREAKTINFGLLYGMGQRKLARDLGISGARAKELIELYFARFPSIREFRQRMIEEAQRNTIVQTIFGRILELKGIHSKNPGIKSEAERIAVNMPIQGSAADLIKRAMLTLHEEIKDDERIMMILQVHDELVFEVRKDYLDEAIVLIRDKMEAALPKEYQDIVSLAVDIGYGKNWYEAH